MTDLISSLLSRAPRYEIKSDSDLTVTIEKDASESIEAELVNISVSGAKIKVSQAILADEVLAMTIEAKLRNRKIVISGGVCWVRPATGDDWWLGCSFNPHIPEEVLREFAEDGTLDCREHERREIALRATVQWELNNEMASAWVLNCSRSGFCLLSQCAGKLGERVRLLFESDDEEVVEVRGKTQWSVESQKGFVIGCEFIESRDFAVLCDLAPDLGISPSGRDDSGSQQSNRQSLPHRSSRIIAASTAVLLCIAIYQSLSSTVKTQQLFDRGADSTDSLAAKSSVVQLDGSNGSDVGHDATQADEPAVTEGARPQAVVGERIRHTASVAPTDNVGAVRTPPAVLGEDKAAESHTRAQRVPADTKTLSNTSTRAPRKLAANRPPAKTTVNREIQNGTPAIVEKPHKVVGDIADPGVIDSGVTAGVRRQTGRMNEKTTATNSAEPTENAGQQESVPQVYRTWVDNTGRYRVVARFVNVEGNRVRLQTEDGRYKLISLDQLSQNDARYVRRRFMAATAPE